MMCRAESVSDSIMAGRSPGDGGYCLKPPLRDAVTSAASHKSAFPIGLNALGRRGLTRDTILRVDKCHKPDPSHAGWGGGGADRQLGPQEMKGAHSFTDILIING